MCADDLVISEAMMTSLHENAFCIAGPMWRESTAGLTSEPTFNIKRYICPFLLNIEVLLKALFHLSVMKNSNTWILLFVCVLNVLANSAQQI